MSGGVDSSAAAALLLAQGYEVIGITLKLWPQKCVNLAEDKCCGPQAVTDARAVCDRLGIPYYLVDESAEFQKHVIQYFAEEYKAGRTPNPCVVCNQIPEVRPAPGPRGSARRAISRHRPFCARGKKRGRLALSAQARTRFAEGSKLFSLSLRQDQLARALFPLGEKTKSDAREVARHCQLKTADKEESMEICFVPDNNYGGFLQSANLVRKHRGEIVDLHGRVLGHHDGIEFYTIGQRKGLGITTPKPVYVIELDAENNRVVVGDDSALDRDEFTAGNCNWHPFDTLAGPSK
jgi:tRNA-specific 2-thiouridylase